MPEQAVNAGLTIPHLGSSFVVDPVNKKVHVKSQVSADAGNKITTGSDGGAFVADTPVWLTQTDGTPATADTDAIQHTGNVALKQNVAYRTKALPTVAQLNATNASNILLTTSGTIDGITGGEDGKQLVLTNTSTGEVTLSNDSLTATAGTKIKIGDSFSFVMAPNASVLLNYDPINTCWRSVSQTVLGFAPQWLRATGGAANQTGVSNTVPISFPVVESANGSKISHPTPTTFLLRAGAKYRLRAIVPHSSNGFFGFRWHNGTALVGTAGYVSTATTGATGVAEAIVAPLVDTTYTVFGVSGGTTTIGNSVAAASVYIEMLEGLSPASDIKLLSRVFVGSSPSPIVTPPVGDPVQGETYIQTDTGLDDGFVISEWRYTGTAWRRVNYIDYPAAIAVSADVRTYYPTRSSLVPFMTSVQKLAQIAAHGFTAVGGASISNYGMYGSYNIIRCNAVRATTATVHNIPTQYIRHEQPIEPGANNTYHFSTLTDRGNFTAIDVWVCDPVTGVPVKRLHANTQASQGVDSHQPLNIAPDNGHPQISSYYEFSSYNIPAALVTAYKTAGNTIKLALRPCNVNNGGGTDEWYIGGWGMTSNPYGLITQPAILSHWQVDGALSPALTWHGDLENIGFASVNANAQGRIRVPVLDVTHDTVITILGRDERYTDSYFGDYSIIHTSGNVQLGRLPVTGQTPYGNAMRNNFLMQKGFVIPASTLAAKTTVPVNGGVPFLELNVKNLSYNWTYYIAGVTSEYLNP